MIGQTPKQIPMHGKRPSRPKANAKQNYWHGGFGYAAACARLKAQRAAIRDARERMNDVIDSVDRGPF